MMAITPSLNAASRSLPTSPSVAEAALCTGSRAEAQFLRR
jgi:hypothetical protein